MKRIVSPVLMLVMVMALSAPCRPLSVSQVQVVEATSEVSQLPLAHSWLGQAPSAEATSLATFDSDLAALPLSCLLVFASCDRVSFKGARESTPYALRGAQVNARGPPPTSTT